MAHVHGLVSSTGAHETVDDLAERNDSWDPLDSRCIDMYVCVYTTYTYVSRTRGVDRLDLDLGWKLISR